jgi:ADP-heptose:LPS heptosyltransferase
LPDTVRQDLKECRIRKVLWIRPQQGIGDLLLCTPAMRALHTTYPHLEMQAVLSPRNSIALKGHSRWSKLWILDKKTSHSPRSFWRWLQALRDERFDLAIVVHAHTPSWTNYALARAVRPGIVWGFDSSSAYGGNNWSREFTDVELPAPDPAAPEWEKFAALVAPLAAVHDFAPEIAISLADQAWADTQRAALPWVDGRPVIGLYLGGNPAHPGRLFPISVWAQLIRELTQQLDAHCLALAPIQSPLYDAVAADYGAPLPKVSDPSFAAAVAFLTRLDLFIVPDGGLFHGAVAGGAQTLGLFRSTDPQRWCPPVPHAQAIRVPDQDAIPSIIAAVRHQLSRSPLCERK